MGVYNRTSNSNNILNHGEMEKTVDLKEPLRKEDNLIIKRQESLSQSLTILMWIIRTQLRLSKAVNGGFRFRVQTITRCV